MARHRVCDESAVPVGSMSAFKAGDTKVLVVHLEDGFFATQSSCTHAFVPLARGQVVEGCQVQCPFHRARFDARTGAVVKPAHFPLGETLLGLKKTTDLKTYPVQVEDGGVFVEV